MINNKPLIIGKRPFWRHPVFPWGWYSMVQDLSLLVDEKEIHAEGHYNPKDGYGGSFCWDKENSAKADDGTIFQIDECAAGRWKNAKEHIKQIAIQKIKFQLYW